MIFDPTITDVTVDESPGLQNTGVATATEDNDDNDVSTTTLTAMLAALALAGAPAEAMAAASGRMLTFAEPGTPSTEFTLAGGGSTVATSLSTTSGFAITLELAGDGAAVLGTYMDGLDKHVAFALVLESDASTGTGDNGGVRVTIVLYEPLAHADASDPDDALDLTGLVFISAGGEIAFNDFRDAPAGQNLWMSVTDDATGVQILATGFVLGVDTVNTRNTSLGSNNQSIETGEGLVFDFVTGQTPPNDTNPKTLSTIDFTARHEGDGGGFTIAQTGGSATTRVDAKLVAYDSAELGVDYQDGTITGGTPMTIGSISVYLGTTLVRSWDGTTATGTDTTVGFAVSGDGVVISGLLVNYRVEFSLVSGVTDRFSVSNVSPTGGNRSFDLSDIRIGAATTDLADVGSDLRFEDDHPLVIAPQTAHVTNGPGDAVSFSLDNDGTPSAFATNFGADGAGTIVFEGTSANNGAALTDTGGTALTSGGVAITLSGFGTSVLTAAAGAVTVFTVTLNTDGTYSVNMDAKIDNGAISFDNFGSGGAGLRYWLGVAGGEDATKDLLVTGGNPGVTAVNNDSDDIGANNQWIDPSESLRLDFVSGIGTTTGTSSLSNIPDATHYDVNDVGFTVMQSKGTKPGVDVQVSAIDAAVNIDGTNTAADLQAGTVDQIISVTVIDGTTDLAVTYLREDGNTAKVTWLTDDVIVRNLNAPSTTERDQVFVSTEDDFSRLLITNVDARPNDAFSIGGFEIAGNAGDAVDTQFSVVLADGDGDPAAAALVGVTFDAA